MINIKFTHSQYNALVEALLMLNDEDSKASPFTRPVKELIKKKMKEAFKENKLEAPYND